MNNKILTCFLCLLLCCCKKNVEYDNSNIKLNITKIKPSKLSLSEFVKKIDYVPLETTDESFIAKIYNVKFACNSYFVFDEKQHILFCFNKDGKYQFKIAEHGKGKGEFIRIFDYDILEETNSLVIRDGVTKKLLFYNAITGKFISEKKAKLKARNIIYTKKGFVAYSLNIPYNTPSNNSELFICDREFKPVDVLTHYPKEFNYIHPNNFMCLYQFSDTIYFSRPWSPNIYSVDIEKNEAKLKYRIDLGNNEFAKKTMGKTQTLENTMAAYRVRHDSKEIIKDSPYYIESNPKFIFKNVLLVNTERKKHCQWIIYDLKNHNYNLFAETINDMDFIYPDKYMFVTGRTEEALICKMDSYEVEQRKNEIMESNISNKVTLSKLSATDNPVLVLLHIK